MTNKKHCGEKICWKKIGTKSIEDATKKAVELIIVLFILGVSSKIIFVTVPAVALASVSAKIIRVMFFNL